MKGKELYSKVLLERRFKKLKRTPSEKFLEVIAFIDNNEADELLNKKEYAELKNKVRGKVKKLERFEMVLVLEVSNVIEKNLKKELWKAYLEKKARETIK